MPRTRNEGEEGRELKTAWEKGVGAAGYAA